MKTTTKTCRIKLQPVYKIKDDFTDEQIKEEKKRVWDKIKKVDEFVYRIANYTASTCWSTWSKYGNVKRGDLPKIEFYKIFSEELCIKYPELKELKISAIASGTIKGVHDKIYKEYYDYIHGKKSIPSFKSGYPIYIARSRSKDEENGIYKSIGKLVNPENKENTFTTPLGDFKLYFGKDKSNNRSIVNKIKTKEYDLLDSTIKYVKKSGEIYLYMVVKIPINKDIKLDEKKFIGVDLGVNYPIVASVYGTDNLIINKDKTYIKESIFIGNREMFLYERVKFSSTRKQLQKNLKYSKGGHGRKRKLLALDNLKTKERNWTRTKNHEFSKQLIDFALKNNVKNIVLENLKGFNENIEHQKFIGRYWSYFELKTLIEEKCKKFDINVFFIDPKNTSKTCSFCGNLDNENRKTQSEFECTSCNIKINADLNATRNIVEKHLKSLSDVKI